MLKRITMTLVLITILTALYGCGNSRTQYTVNDGEQGVSVLDSETSEATPITEPNTKSDGIDAGKIKQHTETTTDEKVIPQWDILNDNNLSFKFKFEGQTKSFTFIAPEDGIYRFSFGIDNVNQSYSVALCKNNHDIINSFRSNKEQNVELNKNEEYVLVFSQDQGLPECNVKAFIPNPAKNVEGNIIKGSIIYKGQEDIYLYKASLGGKYGIKLDISDVNYSYDIIILDSKNQQILNTNYRRSKNSDYYVNADLYEEDFYTIIVRFNDSLNSDSINYEIKIYEPNIPSVLETNTVEGEFIFSGQVNTYYFTPVESGTYNLVFNDSNEPMKYSISFLDEKNHTQGPKNNHSSNVSFELNGGEKYEITICQKQDYGKYRFDIEKKI